MRKDGRRFCFSSSVPSRVLFFYVVVAVVVVVVVVVVFNNWATRKESLENGRRTHTQKHRDPPRTWEFSVLCFDETGGNTNLKKKKRNRTSNEKKTKIRVVGNVPARPSKLFFFLFCFYLETTKNMPTLNAFHSSSGSIFAGGATLEHDANTGLEQSHDGKCH